LAISLLPVIQLGGQQTLRGSIWGSISAQLYETACHIMERNFHVFSGIILFRAVSAKFRKYHFNLIEHQEAGMMGYVKIA
jgi:hypothetical protein